MDVNVRKFYACTNAILSHAKYAKSLKNLIVFVDNGIDPTGAHNILHRS